MSDLHLITIIAIVASALGTPWWYPPLCATVLAAFRIILGAPWWPASGFDEIFLAAAVCGLAIAVGWFVGWFIRQGLLFWTRRG